MVSALLGIILSMLYHDKRDLRGVEKEKKLVLVSSKYDPYLVKEKLEMPPPLGSVADLVHPLLNIGKQPSHF